MQDFKDKVAVITGGASGIGLGLAKRAAGLGMKIVLADIEAEPLALAAADLRELGAEVLERMTDVARAAQVEQLAQDTLQRFGAVHLLFNNAGVGGGGLCWEEELADWELVLGVNLWGVIHGIKSFTPHMVAQGEGHIVNTASIAGLMSAPGTSSYTVSKHAVVALSEVLHGDLNNAGASVGVSVLCPSFVNTEIHAMQRFRPCPGEKSAEQVAEEKIIRDATREFFQTALSPDAVAAQVFAAIADGQFYILTHPEGSALQIERRMRSILDQKSPSVTGAGEFPLA